VEKDMARFEFDINICRHCRKPKCMSECPADAMYMDDRGVVIIVDEKCTRCGACMKNCPFNSIFYNEIEDRYLKCDLCAGRDEGPLCVELCSPQALTLVKPKTAVAEE
jgi:carbon-monoxide dehydrogenase iron sulfur subunit